MIYAGILLVRVLHGVRIRLIRCDLDKNLLWDDLSGLVLILPVNVPESFFGNAYDVARSESSLASETLALFTH